MKRHKIDNRIEREILTGLIMSDEYIRRVCSVWNRDYVEIPYVSIVADWCFEYFNRYDQAPKERIEIIYHRKKRQGMESELADQVEQFLSILSERYEQSDPIDVDFLVDETEKRLQHQSLKNLGEDLTDLTESGRTRDAAQKLLEYKEPRIQVAEWVNPYNDEKAIEQAFTETKESLIKYPDALGQFWNDQLTRDAFVAIMAPEKRGKTFWKLDMSYRACRQKRNVAFFQCGDMSQNQFIRRKAIHLAKRSDRKKYCGMIYVPIADCLYNQNNKCDKSERQDYGEITGNFQDKERLLKENPDHVPCTKCVGTWEFKLSTWFEVIENKPLSWGEAYENGERFVRRMSGREIRTSYHAGGTLSVHDAKAILEQWKNRDGFIPDVILFDYSDIMGIEPMARGMSLRDQIFHRWLALRALSQEGNCLVITSTQTNVDSYDESNITMKNFTDDKRKHSHVTAEYALNQTKEDKQKHIMRIGQVVVREDEFDVMKEVKVLYHLWLGRPYLSSYF